MHVNRKNLLVVGDRVLLSPDKGKERTKVGLYLPASAVDKMAVLTGKVVEVGPGTPVPAPNEIDDEPWKTESKNGGTSYVPLQARVGDRAVFLKNAAVEVEFEDEAYLIVPHAAILLLVRDDDSPKVPDSL